MTIKDILGVKEPVVFKSKKVPVQCAAPDQIVGLEIETENVGYGVDYTALINKLWQVKEDGSLRGRAYEFVSLPCPIGQLIPELEEFWAKTRFTEENYTDRCSIHVHTNITDMTTPQVTSLFLVYSVVEDVLFEFVNHHKAKNDYGYSRDTNLYCVPWSQCRMNHSLAQNMFMDASFAFKAWQKYTALNILPARSIGTLEWRHMHGTADMEKITKWLNLIGSIMRYAKQNEFEAVVKIIKELNDTSAYRQFYGDVLGGYLPFDPKYEVAMAQGVVNAKYSLIGLGKEKVVKKHNLADEIFNQIYGDRWEVAEDAPEEVQAWVDPQVRAVPAGAAGIARGMNQAEADPLNRLRRVLRADVHVQGDLPQDAPAAPVVDNLAGAADRLRQNINEQEDIRLAHGHRMALYPLTKGQFQSDPDNPASLRQWGARDRMGRVFTQRNGQQVTAAQAGTFVASEPVQYVRGFGRHFWHNVNRNYRPDANMMFADQNQARQV